MGMFSNLLGKLFSHASTPVTQTTAASGAPAPVPSSAPTASATPPPDAVPAAAAPVDIPTASTPAPAPQNVDVAAILDGLAKKNPEKLDWKKSIVDMLKLLDMDSGLSARKELATELSYSGDESDSAAMNVWLHKAVMNKIAENGGKVPAELLG